MTWFRKGFQSTLDSEWNQILLKKKKYWISSKTGLDETLYEHTLTYQPFPLLDVTYIPIFKDREQLKFNSKLEGTKTLQW